MSAGQGSDPIVIVGAARTPMGGFQGELAGVTAPELGSAAISAALSRAGVPAADVDEVLMGCVLPHGLKQAPARQAAIGAGLPTSVPCTTVNKMCGSGMKTVMQGYDALAAGTLGDGGIVVAGGMESMTNTPYVLPRVREGLRMGHGDVKDAMFLDGLENAYDGRLMGSFAEDTARELQFTREAQDAYAIESLRRANQAIAEGSFEEEIVPVTVKSRKGETVVAVDEQPGNAAPDKIPSLKPAFAPDGSVTAANSSSISDGGSALVLMNQSTATARGLKPLARIVGHATHARDPEWFTTAPIGAIQTLMARTGWNLADVDLFEINEAFAVVTLAAMRELDLPHEKVNVHGGACALGHPVGSSGSRIIVTLISALRKYGGRKGVAALCIGGGEATAVAVELID
ncbi:MAG TPA: acetyl-CoA C-acetyltransferase [Alphaproteobacteria bacterium]|nr:acetyl-CoA C-acetyltransferase [Alphaproteobacteria bacterium]HCO89548.1 acetyl-CoA C-acetyltransferase [Alphaproteobacteria bacterium]